MDTSDMKVGSGVRVVMSFPSEICVGIGSEGRILKFDEDGDMYVDFGNVGRHWVQMKYFSRLVAYKWYPASPVPAMDTSEMKVDGGVKVAMSFPSNNASSTRDLGIGSEGRILEFDEDGHMTVDFGDIGRRWVQMKYFNRLIAPKHTLMSFDTEGIANYIIEAKASQIVVLCGAGISTSAGIPDFKSLYASGRCASLPTPTAVFEIEYFKSNPSVFYELAREIWPDGGFQPTPAHYFVLLLHLKGLLRKCFTQNIDTLERQAGIPDACCVYAHGNFDGAHVVGDSWNESVESNELKEAVRSRTWKQLNEQKGGLVKPKISFYGEALPGCFYENRFEVEHCDLLIVLGTSLRVGPFNSLVSTASSSAPRLLINNEGVGMCDDLDRGFRFHLDSSNWRDAFYKGSIDDGVRSLASALGWSAELEELIEANGSLAVERASWAKEMKLAEKHIDVGMRVKVVTPFVSNNRQHARELGVDFVGVVLSIDGDGDLHVDFDVYGRHWVRFKHFDKLMVLT